MGKYLNHFENVAQLANYGGNILPLSQSMVNRFNQSLRKVKHPKGKQKTWHQRPWSRIRPSELLFGQDSLFDDNIITLFNLFRVSPILEYEQIDHVLKSLPAGNNLYLEVLNTLKLLRYVYILAEYEYFDTTKHQLIVLNNARIFSDYDVLPFKLATDDNLQQLTPTELLCWVDALRLLNRLNINHYETSYTHIIEIEHLPVVITHYDDHDIAIVLMKKPQQSSFNQLTAWLTNTNPLTELKTSYQHTLKMPVLFYFVDVFDDDCHCYLAYHEITHINPIEWFHRFD